VQNNLKKYFRLQKLSITMWFLNCVGFYFIQVYTTKYLFNSYLYIDEVIRQVTLNCTERGHMLIQIREEIQMTIDAYKELYESVLANGIRKLLRACIIILYFAYIRVLLSKILS